MRFIKRAKTAEFTAKTTEAAVRRLKGTRSLSGAPTSPAKIAAAMTVPPTVVVVQLLSRAISGESKSNVVRGSEIEALIRESPRTRRRALVGTATFHLGMVMSPLIPTAVRAASRTDASRVGTSSTPTSVGLVGSERDIPTSV
jgi:hypothetical protein